MRSNPLKFRFFGIDVFIPFSGWLGLLLIAYFALPTSLNLLNQTSVNAVVVLLALAHALAIYITIFVHELGHVVAAKKLKYEVKGVFLHLFGGHTAFLGKYHKPSDQFWTAIAGPGFTLIISGIAYLFLTFSNGVLNSVSSWLLWSSLVITVVNLLPGVPLDGGSIFASAVWKITGDSSKGQRFAGYGGYLVAAIWISSPFLLNYTLGWQVTELDIFFSSFIGVWLFVSARLTVRMSKIQQTEVVTEDVLGTLRVKDLARRAIAVEESFTLSEATAAMKEAQAGSVLITRDDKVIGIVLEKFLQEDPNQNDEPVSRFATLTNPKDWVNFDEFIVGNEKIDPTFHHGQWIAVDHEGAIYGVLHRSDISQRIVG